jgi:3-oxoacyl-[acyl-carrier-protein] synthase II
MAVRVVVTGMGAVTPVGNDVNTMWESFVSGTHAIAPITKFDASGFDVSLAAEVKGFDPLMYMGKRDSQRCDSFTSFAIGAASQAMEDSRIFGTVLSEKMGVYFSSCMGGVETAESSAKSMIEKGREFVPPLTVPAMISNSAAAMIAIKYSLHGSCFSISTACAASANAIGEAYRAIKDGYLDAAIAGGSDACITEFGLSSFNACRALSKSTDPSRASIPFDLERSGFVMGEGAGALIFEKYEHAVSRGAHIYAEICGYGSSCDAFHITRPAPSAEYAALSIKQSLENVEFDPSKVYFNAHGTSTKLNDETETAAIKKAFGEENAKKLLISSTKSMTGHLLGAAAVVESIAAIKALNESVVPPTVGYEVFDPACDLNVCPNTAVKAQIDIAMTNSLGFGGHNACLAFKKI